MDEAILRALNSLSSIGAFAAIATFLSSIWCALLVTVPLGVHLLFRRRYAAFASIALAMAAGDAIDDRIVKPLVGRERPCRTVEALVTPTGCGPGKSFASGHAVVAFAFLVTAAPELRFGWAIFAPIASLVAGSRSVLGVHWPSDVAAGALLGASIGGAVVLGRKKLALRWVKRRASPEAS